jgi:hydroxypyruvate isomerase
VSFTLAASAEMLYVELPFLDRLKRITERGLQVEIWDWSAKDIGALAASGATFSSMTGYLRGDLTTRDGIAALLATAQESLAAAERLDCPRLNLHGTGLDPQGMPVHPVEVVTPTMWLTAADTLHRIAELGARAERVFTLENLNVSLDHPGTPFARAADTLALARAVDSPHLRLNLDLYHAQIGEGTSSSWSGRRCRTSVRSRWPTCRAAANRAPARSTTARWPRRWPRRATPGSSAWRRSRRATQTQRWTRSKRSSPCDRRPAAATAAGRSSTVIAAPPHVLLGSEQRATIARAELVRRVQVLGPTGAL